MIQNDNTVHDAVYWVSAGAEYNYEMEVFVAQASFTAKTDPEVRFEYGTAGVKKNFFIEEKSCWQLRLRYTNAKFKLFVHSVVVVTDC